MSTITLPQLLQILEGLLTKDQSREAAKTLARQFADPKALARELVKRGWLTTFQATRIFQGQAASLTLGSYVLLDLLGEGGMGQVFRARHSMMDRVVAIKVIRADRLGDAGTVARFHREIKAVSRLSHPNVVHAYDADTIGSTHYFVMEYVTGADLGKWLKDRGPLPAAEACEYVRQAALGLQHAHEHELVHRDVKPSNLMRVESKGGSVIKVLDLGLARLRSELASDQTASELTRTGALMGTPDYLAPEQAANPASADIRADIYSLGCTLYQLLTGQVPFPGGSLAQKLQWHQQAEPAAVDSVRRDLPEGLAAVVHKMLAKRPADRFQTPGEVAEALGPYCSDQQTSPPSAPSGPLAETTMTTPPPAPTQSSRSGCIIAILVAMLLVAVGGVGVLGGMWYLLKDRGRGGEDLVQGDKKDESAPIVVELVGVAKPEDPKEFVFLLDNRAISFEALRKEMALALGAHELVVQQSGVVLERRDFVIAKEDHQKKVVIPEAVLKPGKLSALSGHLGEVSDVAFSGDGLRLLSVGPIAADGAFVWDVPSGRQLYHYRRDKKPSVVKGVTWSGALSHDGHAALIGARHAYKSAAVKPFLVAAGLESSTRLWENLDHTRTINTVQFSRDGKLALSADEAGVTIVWNAATGQKLHQLAGTHACFSPSGDRVLTVSKTQAHLWKLGPPVQELKVFKGHSDLIRSIAFAPDGQHVLTGGDATARLWSVHTGTETRIFKGHEKEVTSVAIAPDGRRVLTGSKDKTVRLWNVAKGDEILRFTEHTDIVTCVAYSPGGRRAASGSQDHTVRLWALPK